MNRRIRCLTAVLLAAAMFIACPQPAAAASKSSTASSKTSSQSGAKIRTVKGLTVPKAKRQKLTGYYVLGGNLYYFKKGKLLRNTWRTVHGKRYFFNKYGASRHAIRKIAGTYYYFTSGFCLGTGKSVRMVKVHGNQYLVDKDGETISGWRIFKKKLYHMTKSGRVEKNVTVEGISLSKTGAAKDGPKTRQFLTAIPIVESITNPGMTKGQKVAACWNYVVGRCSYMGKYPANYSVGAFQDLSVNMLTTHTGNCYGYASAFAALARQCGCNAQVVYGLCRGSRDHRADGMTRHGWVCLDGLYYDPEAQALGWKRGVYGWGGNPYVEHGRVTF